ncbi:MAG TPA: hypothetical protein VNP72_06040 [Longimicrobium sp.]|nr:hypothetical protein [Longimicrobium sp.]
MSIRHGWLLAILLTAACSDASLPVQDAGAAAPRLSAWGTNIDDDGIDDGIEWALANQFAPVLYMPNLITRTEAIIFPGDWAWPASVEWYLPRVRMRIHHNNCNDHQFLDYGQVTPTNLLQQVHQRYTRGLFGCSHESPWQYSNRDFHPDDHYFLEAGVNGDGDAIHPGVRDPGQWKTYVHAYRNNLNGVTLQYWFFYAYNDGISVQNHEGDWEHVDVKLDAANNPVTVYFSFHEKLNPYAPGDVSWYGGTHPQVWVADGSHANFRSESACNTTAREGVFESCWTNTSERWFTWSGGRGYAQGLQGGGLINVGEKFAAMYGQEWIRYSGRWGEKGEFDWSSGPQGPAYKAEWLKDAYVAPYTGGGGTGGGGTGGGDCTGDGGGMMLQQSDGGDVTLDGGGATLQQMALPVCPY